jgi:hypothetical protein
MNPLAINEPGRLNRNGELREPAGQPSFDMATDFVIDVPPDVQPNAKPGEDRDEQSPFEAGQDGTDERANGDSSACS